GAANNASGDQLSQLGNPAPGQLAFGHKLHQRKRRGAVVIVSFLLLAADNNSISLEMETAAQLRGLSHAAYMGAGLDPALREYWSQRIGSGKHDVHAPHSLFGIIGTSNIDTQKLRRHVREFVWQLRMAAV